MFVRTRTLVSILSVVTACGGGGGDETRICQMFQDCINFTDTQVEDCITSLERSTAARAIAECAECMGEASCSELDDGVCADECALALTALEVSASGVSVDRPLTGMTSDEVTTLCEWWIDEWGGPGLASNCGDYTVENPTLSECLRALTTELSAGCQGTVGDFEACIDATWGDACNVLSAPACQFLTSC